MPVVQVRIMRMAVHHVRMPMNMDMRFSGWVVRRMSMAVVLVMHIGMLMQHLLVFMLVLVMLDQM